MIKVLTPEPLISNMEILFQLVHKQGAGGKGADRVMSTHTIKRQSSLCF